MFEKDVPIQFFFSLGLKRCFMLGFSLAMCIYLHYRINKQRDTLFKFSSILSTVDLSEHLITAWVIKKFIQLVSFVTNNNVKYVFSFLLRQSSMVKPVWADTFEKWETSMGGRETLICKGDKFSSSRIQIKDSGLTYGIDDETSLFLAVKVSFRMH